VTLVNKIELFRTTFRNAFPMSTAKLHVSRVSVTVRISLVVKLN